ncbi:uncharacterized protein MONOS_17643 [Monocercomonoides exilis]|uniref:uncharacterized protein n=1 Tax=Monocercomonoides exilis TaxID=2049356 RepID=UPI003559F04C|nr:hypothetical protein MONOS_17643 [Monocercomonoides exilis]
MSRISPVNCIEEDKEYEEKEEEEEDNDESVYEEFKSDLTEKFTKLLHELEYCDEEGQKQKIDEMNEMLYETNEEESRKILLTNPIGAICKMINEKKLSIGKVSVLMKHFGCYTHSKHVGSNTFYFGMLSSRIEKMIIEEEKKNEEKNEHLLVDLCECYLSLSYNYLPKIFRICVRCLLDVALKKEEDEETQKEVEMALLALRNIYSDFEVKQRLYLNKITEIIQCHQEHHNLTRLAYQSAWEFLIERFNEDQTLKKVIVNELHFVREAAREMEALKECVDWKRKEDKEMKERIILERWLDALDVFGRLGKIQNEEYVRLTRCIIDLCRAAKCNHRKVYENSNLFLDNIILKKAESEDYLPCEEAIDFILEEMLQPTINDELLTFGRRVFYKLSRILSRKMEKKNSLSSFVWFAWSWLNGKAKEESEKAKQKMMLYRKLREKMEEEGYEDIVISFYRSNFYFAGIWRLSNDLNDYLIHH